MKTKRNIVVRQPNGVETLFMSPYQAWNYAVAVLGTLWIAGVQIRVKGARHE